MIRTAWIFLIAVTLSSCAKVTNLVPDVPVNLTLPLTDPRLINLSSSGRPAVIDGYGVSGLILYKNISGRYVAYDRCSTVNPDKRCAVTVDTGAFSVTDPCSGAKFSLEDGSPVKAPATVALRQYDVRIVGGNTIQVTN